MLIDDDAVLAYRALRELGLLYDAYRAAARAHAAILSRASAPTVRADGPTVDADVTIRLEERRALARQTDAVCAVRADQVRRRMAQLRASRAP